MSRWNYRVTRERVGDEFLFAVREVYYDDDGSPVGWSQDPIAATGEAAADVADELVRMSGCLGYGVLDLETREVIH